MTPSLVRLILLSLPLLCAPAMAAEKTSSASTPPTGKAPALVWRGDITSSRALIDDLAAAWKKEGHTKMVLEPFSTISGIDAVAAGSADIAGSARPPFAKRPREQTLNFVPVAWDGLVMITHPDNPVSGISLKQLYEIYYGHIKNWKALGGKDHEINLYAVASPLDGVEYSLRQLLFRRGNQPVAAPRLYVNTAKLEEAVTIDPSGLGVTTLSNVLSNSKVKMLAVQGVTPSDATIENGSYPLYAPLYLAYDPDGAHAMEVKTFLDFVDSAPAEKIMRENDLVPYSAAAQLATQQDAHLQRVADLAHPPMNGPVAAPGATYASKAAIAQGAESTRRARERLQAARAREQAEHVAAQPAQSNGNKTANAANTASTRHHATKAASRKAVAETHATGSAARSTAASSKSQSRPRVASETKQTMKTPHKAAPKVVAKQAAAKQTLASQHKKPAPESTRVVKAGKSRPEPSKADAKASPAGKTVASTRKPDKTAAKKTAGKTDFSSVKAGAKSTKKARPSFDNVKADADTAKGNGG